ncbi:hypothetical protein Dda_6669 [Drechslerella dactyloides]|uniref:ABC transporter domain-containing protein n=1 Tax=Drechslerella dactyloides TaxID=74499 RepID=A0AAD6NHR7_DREDA|nr:hypothetical protein Dda_6669 [Drechslerella dactyloides]
MSTALDPEIHDMTSPIVRIVNSTFHRTPAGPAFFPSLSFSIPSLASARPQRWSIIGPSDAGKSTFLQVLQGSHLCVPPTGRAFPALTIQRKYPVSSIGLVDFGARGTFGEPVVGEYMSSRYESRRGATDLTLRQWLERTALDLPLYTDNFDFAAHDASRAAEVPLTAVTTGLRLEKLLEQPVSTLSNGQGRRARIAQALLKGVDLLLLDEPFMGLDPWSVEQLSDLLEKISSPEATSITSQVVLAQRPQDHLPDWVTHIVYLQGGKVAAMGSRDDVIAEVARRGVVIGDSSRDHGILERVYQSTNIDSPKEKEDPDAKARDDALVEMDGIRIFYRDREILKDFSWTVKRGERWGLFGPNGSGKTTLLSIITSDHPLSYSQPVKLFGRSRLPTRGTPGISIFELQSLIGHSSPEIHQFFPRNLALRRAVESAHADTFLSPPRLPRGAREAIDSIFKSFDISETAQQRPFGECSVSMQRLALFMRAVVKRPDIVILDEAFSGMDEGLRDKCMRYLQEALEDRQALIVVSHLDGEIPAVVDRWVRLREAGDTESAIFGRNCGLFHGRDAILSNLARFSCDGRNGLLPPHDVRKGVTENFKVAPSPILTVYRKRNLPHATPHLPLLAPPRLRHTAVFTYRKPSPTNHPPENLSDNSIRIPVRAAPKRTEYEMRHTLHLRHAHDATNRGHDTLIVALTRVRQLDLPLSRLRVPLSIPSQLRPSRRGSGDDVDVIPVRRRQHVVLAVHEDQHVGSVYHLGWKWSVRSAGYSVERRHSVSSCAWEPLSTPPPGVVVDAMFSTAIRDVARSAGDNRCMIEAAASKVSLCMIDMAGILVQDGEVRGYVFPGGGDAGLRARGVREDVGDGGVYRLFGQAGALGFGGGHAVAAAAASSASSASTSSAPSAGLVLTAVVAAG